MWRHLTTAARALAPLSFALHVSGALSEGSPFPTTFPYGLTTTGATSSHYTTSLDLKCPLLLRGSGDFMAAARADARARLQLAVGGVSSPEAQAVEDEVKEHLRLASLARTRFLDRGSAHGCEELRGALHHVVMEKGQLALLLGGRSLGKTLLLKELAGQRQDTVGEDGALHTLLYVDARSCGGNLAAGLVAALQKEAREQALAKGQGPTEAAGSDPQLDWSSLGGGKVVEQTMGLLSRLSDAAQVQGYHLCLIIDEANLCFPAPPEDHPLTPELAQAKQLLEKLVELTKQGRRMSVLLVSSDCAYPSSLRRGGYFDPSNFTRTLFAGEVPPAGMRDLLQGKWGLGPQLSDVFLAHYGGHVHLASQALSLLSQQLDGFHCLQAAPGLLDSDISACLTASDRGAMAAMLSAVALHGCAPVRNVGDVSAQGISQAGIGGTVSACATVVGLPKSQSQGSTRYAVVPTSQFVRNLIALELYQRELPASSR